LKNSCLFEFALFCFWFCKFSFYKWQQKMFFMIIMKNTWVSYTLINLTRTSIWINGYLIQFIFSKVIRQQIFVKIKMEIPISILNMKREMLKPAINYRLQETSNQNKVHQNVFPRVYLWMRLFVRCCICDKVWGV